MVEGTTKTIHLKHKTRDEFLVLKPFLEPAINGTPEITFANVAMLLQWTHEYFFDQLKTLVVDRARTRFLSSVDVLIVADRFAIDGLLQDCLASWTRRLHAWVSARGTAFLILAACDG